MGTAGSHRTRGIKKMVAFPGSVMAMSHQLWMSGRTHCPPPMQREPGSWAKCPGPSEFFAQGEVSVPGLLSCPRPLLSAASYQADWQWWGLKSERQTGRWAGERPTALFVLVIFCKSALQLGCQVCVDGDCCADRGWTAPVEWMCSSVARREESVFSSCGRHGSDYIIRHKGFFCKIENVGNK